jgi:hypothetical protein
LEVRNPKNFVVRAASFKQHRRQSDGIFVKARWTIAVVALLVLSGFLWLKWKRDEPRRDCLQALGRLDAALRTGNSADLLNTVCVPAAIQGRTGPEETQFLSRAVVDGISSASRSAVFSPKPFGLRAVRREPTGEGGSSSQMNNVPS